MTHRRKPGSVEDGVHIAIKGLTIDELQDAAGISLDALYKIANPTTSRELNFKRGAQLEAALIAKGQAPVFVPILRELVRENLKRLGGRGHNSLDTFERMNGIAAEVGDVHEEVRRGLKNDGLLDREERHRVRVAGQEAIREIQKLIEDMDEIDRREDAGPVVVADAAE